MWWLVNQQKVPVQKRLIVKVAKSGSVCLVKSCHVKNWSLCEGIISRFPKAGVYLKPVQKLSTNIRERLYHCYSDSGAGCQNVVHACPVKKSQVCRMKTVPVRSMCKVYEDARTVIQGQ